MSRSYDKSRAMFAEAQQYIPGGVNSPVRAFKAVGTDPVFIQRGDGPYLWDVDDNRYVDYVGSWGPLILGHRHPAVIKALGDCLELGTSYGAPTELETQLARMVCEAVPTLEMVRMVNSGTEATMSALRLARGYTNRNKIIKFEGCYHGHADLLLIKAGSGALTLGVPNSPGVPANTASNTITAPFNNLAALEDIFAQHGDDIAAVIIEPVAGNMGVVPPQPGYLEGLREITKQHGALLIFDEVMTGFRVAYGGAQGVYNIEPDLSCFGKVIGGGLPVGAYGGKKAIMEQVSPAGPVYQAGTLSGNPLAMTAGIATLKELNKPNIYQELERKSAKIAQGFAEAAAGAGVAVSQNRVGAMFCTFFTPEKVVDFDTACTADTKLYAQFFRAMLDQGVYLAPSQFEASFMSTTHSDDDIEFTIAAAHKAFKAIAQK